MINIMKWLYELFNVDQIRIIFVSMFSSLLAYLTPTKGFLIALIIMFGFNIWCGMRADGVSIRVLGAGSWRYVVKTSNGVSLKMPWSNLFSIL